MSTFADQELVDAHHHLWDLQAVHYPWLAARGVQRFFGDPTPIQRDYRAAEYQLDVADLPVAASVHIQVGAADEDAVKETRWVQAQSEASGFCGGIVAYCDLSSGNFRRQLALHLASPNLRGIRQILGRSAEEDANSDTGSLLSKRTWRDNLAALPRFGLSFDLQLVPAQMDAAYCVLREVEDLRVAVCHAGSPWDQTPAGLAHWRAGLEKLATLPRTFCKLSGFGMFDYTWSVGSVQRIVDTCIELFGPQRCMFGSNFPVERLRTGYQALWRRYVDLISGFGHDEQASLLARTARKFYRLGGSARNPSANALAPATRNA